MLYSIQPFATYSPETLAVAGTAFDRVYQSASMPNVTEHSKWTLARIIFRLIDQGELNPEILAETASREWSALTFGKFEPAEQFGIEPPILEILSRIETALARRAA